MTNKRNNIFSLVREKLEDIANARREAEEKMKDIKKIEETIDRLDKKYRYF